MYSYLSDCLQTPGFHDVASFCPDHYGLSMSELPSKPSPTYAEQQGPKPDCMAKTNQPEVASWEPNFITAYEGMKGCNIMQHIALESPPDDLIVHSCSRHLKNIC